MKKNIYEAKTKEDAINKALEDLNTTEENLIIKGIQPKTKVEQLKGNIQSEMSYQIIDETGNVVSDIENARTGYKIKIEDDKIYTIIVIGDANGDGKADIQDIFAINKHRLNKANLTGEYLLASDVNEDGETDFKDILQINKFRLGKIEEL